MNNNNNQNNLLVTLADANFVDQAKQLFSSVYFKAGWEGDYLLIASGIAEEDLAWFRNKGILVYEAPFLSAVPLGVKKYPPILLSKFYLFKEYFKKWRKIIYLDADIIVRASLNGLLNSTSFNAPNAATYRLKNEFIGDKNKNKEIRKKFNLRGRAFCSGVFVFDTDLISDNTFTELLALYSQFLGSYQGGEEPALNLFFYQKWKMLPLIYNFIPSYMSKIYGINNDLAAIAIHFVCAGVKPWEKNSAYYQEWAANLKRAEDIDLSRRPGVAKTLSAKEIRDYLGYLKLKKTINFLFRFLLFIYKIYRKAICSVDRKIGRLGLYLKKNNPDFYNFLCRKIKKI